MISRNKLKICSLNTQGLAETQKRRDIFHYVKTLKCSIVCLQDTHFTKNVESWIEHEWGYKCFFNSFSSQSRGTAILLNNDFQYEIHNVVTDKTGNMVVIDITIESHRITLANIYAPNRDNPDFFNKLNIIIQNIGNNEIIIVGDWNLLLDMELDGINYKHRNNPKSIGRVKQMMYDLNLFDIWREKNTDVRNYTWARRLNDRHIQKGRLDFFLTTSNIMELNSHVFIGSSYRSDHKMIFLELELSKKIGKREGFWKFNNSLLKNPEFAEEVKKTLHELKKTFAATPYNPDKIADINPESYQSIINPQSFYEMLLLKLREVTVSFSKRLKRKTLQKEKELENEIKVLEQIADAGKYNELMNKRQELQTIRAKVIHGVMIRSKARWIDEGEKVTRYFCNLENRNYISKSMYKLIRNDLKETEDPKEIIEEVTAYYRYLYSSQEEYVSNVDLNERLTEDIQKLEEEKADLLEGLITYKEATEVLSKMKNFKSPGTTGFTVEFFKFFWRDLGIFMVKSLNYGFETGSLSITQREGLIVCIPKPNKRNCIQKIGDLFRNLMYHRK